MAKAADIINLNSKATWRLREERDEFSDQVKSLKSDKLKMKNELEESNEEILLLRKENEQLHKDLNKIDSVEESDDEEIANLDLSEFEITNLNSTNLEILNNNINNDNDC
ncbi:hypothetical protein BpHYR1_007958 [Brachionus plicatilis]|uniref:Uncharacterized protein n=1 Tax=Brachionus plicatilis TaxID=10195 RepID=A0A3M7QBF2_BRAPC|nr:hypothetical protein BpHYR1_007958 [Brachionus plicatilis]